MMSVETIGSSLYSRMPASSPSAAAFDRRIDLLDRNIALELDDEVDDRAVGHRHPHRHAVQLPVELGIDLADRSGRTGGRGDDVLGCRSGATQIFMGHIGQPLVVRVGVDGGHQATLDAERLVEHFGEWREAVSRARGVGDDHVVGRQLCRR